MERNNTSGTRNHRFRGSLLVGLGLLIGVAGILRAAEPGPPAESAPDWAAFEAAIAAGNDSGALAVGDALFNAMRKKYRANAGFLAFEGRLKAAEFLTSQMHQQLSRATSAQLSSVAGELSAPNAGARPPAASTVAPAKQFLQTSARLFARPIVIENLGSEEKSFLARYYDLKLRSHVAAVARAGQALAIAEPGFHGTHDYVLVLPLLHASEGDPVKTNILPPWMCTPEQLTELSSCALLSFELPVSAMAIAGKAAEAGNQPFSELAFYREAAVRCGKSRAHVAVDCLNKAARFVPENDAATRIALSFDIIQLWLDSANYSLAAGEARRALQTGPQPQDFARATWLYYYALSRANSVQEVLTDIDQALGDPRCEPYKVRLLYIKWWALRRQRDQGARVAALEHELLDRYGDDPIVAPILLSRATDFLASQAYDDARLTLGQLAEKFPATKAAQQAQRMLEKLGSAKSSK